jgi:hypothetical protein
MPDLQGAPKKSPVLKPDILQRVAMSLGIELTCTRLQEWRRNYDFWTYNYCAILTLYMSTSQLNSQRCRHERSQQNV